jgi:two-component system, chemotaxis family, protein-glutamate methylesterase/glutaminase
MIRLLLADDSATARELLRAILEQEGDLRIVGEARDGAEAVRLARQLRPDIIVMDVHMPVVDGITATKQIMTERPTPILIVSAATQRDVDLSLTATQAGALMALPKPDGPGSPRFDESAAELREMARAMSQVKVVRYSASFAASERPSVSRRGSPKAIELVALAASTGGPAALRQVLTALPPTFPAPILVVQHIARDFAAGFADWLGSGCSLRVKVAKHEEQIQPGSVYVAPDDVHLGVTASGKIRLSKEPAIGGFRPSASHLFESAGRSYGRRLAAVVMTGMGTDGAEGLVAAHAAGAYVIAQDESTSVVYGMAHEAVRQGAVDTILPLVQIAPHLVETVRRAERAG